MAPRHIVEAVHHYLDVLPSVGIHPTDAILYGSQLRGTANEESDIDLIVIAPEFDDSTDPFLENRLWSALIHADNRIEPIACGTNAWARGTDRPIIEIARKEGVSVGLAARSAAAV